MTRSGWAIGLLVVAFGGWLVCELYWVAEVISK